jgi:hypothetical protein
MRALSKVFVICMLISTADYPQTNGQTEVFNGNLFALLRTSVNMYHSFWDSALAGCIHAYINTVHSSTVLLLQWLSGVASLHLKRTRHPYHLWRLGWQACPGNQQKEFHAGGRPDAVRLMGHPHKY